METSGHIVVASDSPQSIESLNPRVAIKLLLIPICYQIVYKAVNHQILELLRGGFRAWRHCYWIIIKWLYHFCHTVYPNTLLNDYTTFVIQFIQIHYPSKTNQCQRQFLLSPSSLLISINCHQSNYQLLSKQTNRSFVKIHKKQTLQLHYLTDILQLDLYTVGFLVKWVLSHIQGLVTSSTPF